MELIDGKKVSSDIKKEIAAEVAEMMAAGKKQPILLLCLWDTMAVAKLMWLQR